MKTTDPIDAARVQLLLGELRLPGIKQMWEDFAARADKEGWPLLASLLHSPSMKWQSAVVAASNATLARLTCLVTRP